MQVILETGNRIMSIEQAIQKLKVKLKKDGFFLELKKHESYTKPSTRRREARAKAVARECRRQRQWAEQFIAQSPRNR